VPSRDTELWMERVPAGGDFDPWVVLASGREGLNDPVVQRFIATAQRILAARAEVASVSLLSAAAAAQRGWPSPPAPSSSLTWHIDAPALPLCIFSGRVADLIDLTPNEHANTVPLERFRQLAGNATAKGLTHTCVVVADGWPAVLGDHPSRPSLTGGETTPAPPFVLSTEATAPGERRELSVGIDAAWLLGGESGAQIAAFSMIRELSQRQEIGRIVLLSHVGGVPAALEGVDKVIGVAWPEVEAGRHPRLDLVHRPYQPGADADFRRYHLAGPCVALTILDFIAYDNPAYHESPRAWHDYQRDFDRKICLADTVFAISRHVGDRVVAQYSHRLAGPVRPILLGTDHLEDSSWPAAAPAAAEWIGDDPFLLVLGNDFQHKNREFAVKVYCRMRARGWKGRLVLAGFQLDAGSTHGHELDGAGDSVDGILRTGSVSSTEKRWLLGRAAVVLYPTSSEGFGLIPFEAAALGTPTAFVRFGPLRETMPLVNACGGWQVDAFADHVFLLLANPQMQIDQILAAGRALSWAAHVDSLIEGYQYMVRDGAPWVRARVQLPGRRERLANLVAATARRVTGKLSRLAGLR